MPGQRDRAVSPAPEPHRFTVSGEAVREDADIQSQQNGPFPFPANIQNRFRAQNALRTSVRMNGSETPLHAKKIRPLAYGRAQAEALRHKTAYRAVENEDYVEPPQRNFDCGNYDTCLSLAAALDWKSFSCEQSRDGPQCIGKVNQQLLWKAKREVRKNSALRIFCNIKTGS